MSEQNSSNKDVTAPPSVGKLDLKAKLAKFKLPRINFKFGQKISLPAFVGRLKLPQLPNRNAFIWIVVALVAVAAIASPALVASFFQSGPSRLGWYTTAGGQANILFVPPAPNWPLMIANLGFFLPWIIWLANIPLLLFQLHRERKEVKELSDFWVVVAIVVGFWLTRVFPAAIGSIGSGIFAWLGGVNPVPWRAEDLIPAAGLAGLGLAYLAAAKGKFDWTPFSVSAVLIAVIYRGYETADVSWARLFMFAGLVTGMLEVLRAPVRQNSDRAASLSLVLGGGVIFLALRGLIGGFVTNQMQVIASPPEWYVPLGQLLFANANLIGMVLAAIIAWQLRWKAGQVFAWIVTKLDDTKDLGRLKPHDGLRSHDSTLLAQYALLALWLFTGSIS